MMVQFDVKRVQKGTESFMVSFDFNKTPITQIADYIIIAASRYGTSDIHFDPREEGMMVRFRIDGDLQDYTFVPKAYEKNLTTRLKIMANMNITESRLPQDGAIKGTFGDQYLDMRVSDLPLNEGEKIVVRILDYSKSLEGIETLGFHPNNLEKIRRMMNIPNGIILTTGATGSGKSTTTYSILQGLNKPETNIITVEDPIEMNIEGINQVQVNAEIGMTFAAALRSILRQDPNIILIGEIRDSETAQIAVRASITGHLVLSTIHTNNALATIERLLDMDVERYLLATSLSGIISQRLAKMICQDCKYQRATTKYEKKVFKKYMNMDVEQVWDANPNGCEHCRKGYHGRIAFHEVLEIDESVRTALSNEDLEKKELAKMVYTGKTITMLQDALIKCLEGLTSFEEVYRNIEIENEDDDNYENEMATEIKEAIPQEATVQVSDDLLETPIQQNQTSEVLVPATFTAESFTQQENPEQQQVQTQPQQEVIPTVDQTQVVQPTTPEVVMPDPNTVATPEVAIPDPNVVTTPVDQTQIATPEVPQEPVIPDQTTNMVPDVQTMVTEQVPTTNEVVPSVIPTIQENNAPGIDPSQNPLPVEQPAEEQPVEQVTTQQIIPVIPIVSESPEQPAETPVEATTTEAAPAATTQSIIPVINITPPPEQAAPEGETAVDVSQLPTL
jgi:type IV pilus assembly protein PilB